MSTETKLFPNSGMQPMIILPPGEMNSTNMALLRKNGICVVTSKNPERVKFVDPIPCAGDRSKIETAAIKFSRRILKQGCWTNPELRKTLTEMFVDVLIKGTSLDPEPQKEEMERQIYNSEREQEIRKMAREDARAEREAKKKPVLPPKMP